MIICVAESTSITEVNVINPVKLYGSKVNEIECLENILQSEFEKFCATKKPVLWPGMAFNWDVPGIYYMITYSFCMPTNNYLFIIIIEYSELRWDIERKGLILLLGIESGIEFKYWEKVSINMVR